MAQEGEAAPAVSATLMRSPAERAASRSKVAKAKAGDLALAGARVQQATPEKDIFGLVVFFLLAFGCAGFSIVMITRRSPMMSALSLLVVFICLAGIYILLKAPFMAAIQIIVYAGAVIVLFIFVIMSMGLKETYTARGLAREVTYFMAGLLLTGSAAMIYYFSQGILGMGLAALLLVGTGVGFVVFLEYPVTRLLGMAAAAFASVQLMRLATLTGVALEVPRKAGEAMVNVPVAAPLPDDFGGAQSVGRSVFLENAFAFEALALLLLAAVVAAVVIVRSRKEVES